MGGMASLQHLVDSRYQFGPVAPYIIPVSKSQYETIVDLWGPKKKTRHEKLEWKWANKK